MLVPGSDPFCAPHACLETIMRSSCVVRITQRSVMGTKRFPLAASRFWCWRDTTTRVYRQTRGHAVSSSFDADVQIWIVSTVGTKRFRCGEMLSCLFSMSSQTRFIFNLGAKRCRCAKVMSRPTSLRAPRWVQRRSTSSQAGTASLLGHHCFDVAHVHDHTVSLSSHVVLHGHTLGWLRGPGSHEN